jgi:hypothetical protein
MRCRCRVEARSPALLPAQHVAQRRVRYLPGIFGAATAFDRDVSVATTADFHMATRIETEGGEVDAGFRETGTRAQQDVCIAALMSESGDNVQVGKGRLRSPEQNNRCCVGNQRPESLWPISIEGPPCSQRQPLTENQGVPSSNLGLGTKLPNSDPAKESCRPPSLRTDLTACQGRSAPSTCSKKPGRLRSSMAVSAPVAWPR